MIRRRRIGAGAVLAVALCAAAACGSGTESGGVASAGTGAAPGATASADPAAGMAKFAACMRDNGVAVPDPDPETGQIDLGELRSAGGDKFQKAMDECRDLLVAADTGDTFDAEEFEQLRQFARCMRDHGVNLPDPDPDSEQMFGGAMAGMDRGDPTFKKAIEACRDKLPQSITDRRGGS